jgi:hypothetical protein
MKMESKRRTYEVECISPQGTHQAATLTLITIQAHVNYKLELTGTGLGTVACEGDDAFDCLCKVRKQVEPLGWLILCNGSRRNAWPSGMCRDMGEGLKLYVLRRKPLSSTDLVDTFGAAPTKEVTSLSEQVSLASAFFGRPVHY